jgi:hypothetical protein
MTAPASCCGAFHSKVDVDRFSVRAFEIIEIELEVIAPISAIRRS